MPEVCPHLPLVGRPSSSYTLRIEHTRRPNISKSAEKSSFVVPANFSIDAKDVRPNWSRDFSIPGKYTLEQLSEIILSLLGWDRNHLYEFRIANFVYANLVLLEEDDCVVDVEYPCVSCDIRIRDVGLAIGDNFTYIFDFTDHHVFHLTVLDIRPASSAPKVTASLISYQGTNITQYPGIMSKSQEQAFKNRIPKILTMPIRDRCRIRFIRHKDASVLRQWRASNDKRNWQKAVTVLESRNQSIEGIARKIERSEGRVRKWIQLFNRFGLTGLHKPDGRGLLKPHHLRAVVREKKARRILEIFHANPNAYGINRSNWNRQSVKQAYEKGTERR